MTKGNAAKLLVLSVVLLTAMLAAKATNHKKNISGLQTLNASNDGNGSQHQATAAISGPSLITCTKASCSSSGSDSRCYVVAPGFSGQLNPYDLNNNHAGASGAGTVTLTCNGTGACACQATVRGQ